MENKLKELRLSSGLELEDISRVTRINLRYLQAIEESDFSKLPGEVYVRGYIKEYAKCLGVSHAPAIHEYEAYRETRLGARPPARKARVEKGNYSFTWNSFFRKERPA